MPKLMCSRTVTSLSPDERNGHKPSIVTNFWGDKSLGIRGSRKGPGRKPKEEEPKRDPVWYKNLIVLDEETLKPVKLKDKKKNWTPPADKTITLDQLIMKFQKERNA